MRQRPCLLHTNFCGLSYSIPCYISTVWAAFHADAILEAFFNGQAQGTAFAQVRLSISYFIGDQALASSLIEQDAAQLRANSLINCEHVNLEFREKNVMACV